MKNFIKKYSAVFLFSFMATVAMIIVVVTSVMMSRSTDLIIENSSKKLVATSLLVAELARGEELEEFFDWSAVQNDDELFEKYANLKQRLADLAIEADVEFTYFLRLNKTDNLMYFVIDNEPIERDEYDPNPDGGVFREAIPDAVMESRQPKTTALGSYSDGWENYMTAYAPVFNSSGEVIALAGVDAEDKLIIESRSNNIILTATLLVSITLLLTIGVFTLFMFRRKAALAESANVAKSSFLSRMSHEMRTPMNAIIGLCRMAKETDDQEKIDSYLENISAASKHLRQVIDDVLDLSKIESGKAVTELVEIDFFKEISNVEVIIKTTADAKNQNLVFEVDNTIPRRLVCDITHLRQVVLNLLSNAIKFTLEHGTVSLSVKVLENTGNKCNLQWRISDNGIGIDKNSIAKLFKPFEQGDTSTTRKFGGTGLGLAISKQFVEMMGGTITVESEPGNGSTFIFNCILGIPENSTDNFVHLDEADETEFVKPDIRGKNILLVEDSELNRLIAEDVFASYGANVDAAVDGQDGYEKYCENPEKYDLIFMDIQMPVLDGYSATRKIRNSGKSTATTVPIIAMTANVFREDVEKAMAAGMNAHVGKPFEIEQIDRAIAKVLKNKSC